MSSAPDRSHLTTVALNAPQPVFRLFDSVALIVGMMIGAGIFKAPSLVAANAGGDETMFMLAWFAGGVISLIGALCYAELAATYPHTGGEYHFLHRAFGKNLAFLFAWARLTVIPTGSIALLAFVFGDYAAQLIGSGPASAPLYAAAVVVCLTALNVLGIRFGKGTQNLLTGLEVAGLATVILVGAMLVAPAVTPIAASITANGAATVNPVAASLWGPMMIFVLLSYGGWNEAAYISSELKGDRRQVLRALLFSIGAVTLIYVLVNVAYLRGLGLAALGQSPAVAADLLRAYGGERGAQFISLLISVAALTSVNATIIFAARTNYTLGRDFPAFSALGQWDGRSGAPTNALLAQAMISLGLIFLGTATRKGFETMVDYTAPVFWFFFLLVGLSLFVLRVREPHAVRPFRVPLYPLTPIIFCCVCAFLLYSSLAYTGVGALFGVAVLAVGVVVLLSMRLFERRLSEKGVGQ